MSTIIQADQLAELASTLFERDWNKTHVYGSHTVLANNGDWIYTDEAQDEFNAIYDLLDEYINAEEKL